MTDPIELRNLRNLILCGDDVVEQVYMTSDTLPYSVRDSVGDIMRSFAVFKAECRKIVRLG